MKKKYTPKYRRVTSLYRKLSEIVERGDKNFETNFPSFTEKDEMTFMTKTAFYIDYCTDYDKKADNLALNIRKWALNNSNSETDFIIIKKVHLIPISIETQQACRFVQYQKSKDRNAEILVKNVKMWAQNKFKFQSDIIIIQKMDRFPELTKKLHLFDQEREIISNSRKKRKSKKLVI